MWIKLRPELRVHIYTSNIDVSSYPPYLEAVSSICNPKTRHAVVTGTHINIGELKVKLSLGCNRASRHEGVLGVAEVYIHAFFTLALVE
jgi:hypothetical protein